MTTPLLCERVERRHPQEKCASKCVVLMSDKLQFVVFWRTSFSSRLSDKLKHVGQSLEASPNGMAAVC